MKKLVFSVVTLLAFSLFSFADVNEEQKDVFLDPSCEEDMFDAMDWAIEEGFDDQTISYIGNWAYANCWLRQTSVNNPSF